MSDDPQTNQQLPDDQPFAEGAGEDSSPAARTSPIRPTNPQNSDTSPKAPPPARPVVPRPSTRGIPLSPQEDKLSPSEKVQLALDQIRQKMDKTVKEYSEGEINQAQFHAIYQRYSEQMEITQRLLERNPNSEAWESVVQPGYTGFLRDHYSAKILSYGLYRIDTGEQIVLHGRLRLPQNQLQPIFHKLYRILNEGRSVNPAARQLKDGNWVVMVPGRYTAAVIIFSGEPAAIQHKRMRDIHYDFERANMKLIATGTFNPAQLVFPHRTLFN